MNNYELGLLKELMMRELKEAIRLASQMATSPNEEVMRIYYDIKTNPIKPILVTEEIDLAPIVNKHGDNGYVVISAVDSDKSEEENIANTKSLLDDIRRSGYSYLPVYEGCDEYVPSFIVFNHPRYKEETDFKELRDLAIEWCGKYKQKTVTIKIPGELLIFVDKNGDKVVEPSLKEAKNCGIYLNPIPCQLSERMQRVGEVMIWDIFTS